MKMLKSGRERGIIRALPKLPAATTGSVGTYDSTRGDAPNGSMIKVVGASH
jgi:hypothetical protein